MREQEKILKKLIILINQIRPIEKSLKKKLDKFNYIDNGHLDSMEIIKFNLSVESKFKIKIKPHETIKKKNQTLRGLASIMFKQLSNKL